MKIGDEFYVKGFTGDGDVILENPRGFEALVPQEILGEYEHEADIAS